MTGDMASIEQRLSEIERLWLFLDYDGTLADFAPTPEHVQPDPEVIDLLTRLTKHPRIRLAVVSGRRLAHVAALVPVPGILLAGTYGIELQTPTGEQVNRLAYESVRPTLDALKPRWSQIIVEREGFFLEDKGWALAIHARFAEEGMYEEILIQARHMAEQTMDEEIFRILGGHKFLEIGPRLAHKGRTVAYVLSHYPWPQALPLYVGDDDKDEEAFEVIKSREGMAVVVSAEPRDTQAHGRLAGPFAVRRWLSTLPDLLGADR